MRFHEAVDPGGAERVTLDTRQDASSRLVALGDTRAELVLPIVLRSAPGEYLVATLGGAQKGGIGSSRPRRTDATTSPAFVARSLLYDSILILRPRSALATGTVMSSMPSLKFAEILFSSAPAGSGNARWKLP
jgi:hypothetical protein